MPDAFHSLSRALAASVVPVLDPASPNAAAINHLFHLVTLICLAVLVVIGGLIVTSVIRFRVTGPREPKQDFGSHQREIAWAIIPVVIVLVLAVASANLIVSTLSVPTRDLAEPGDADLIVVGHQWWWEVRYPASGVVTANEIHIPIGRKFRVRVNSADVIHSFWVPQLAPKMDMIPGHANFVWLQADRAGTYEGSCAEFCGNQHAWMRFIVVAEEPPEYQTWLDRQLQPAPVPGAGEARSVTGAGAQAGGAFFFAQTCASCHAIGGTRAVANAAPDLTHFASRTQLAAGIVPNTPTNLARWLKDPQQIKPGCLMPNFSLTDDQVNQLVTFLEGLR